MNNSQEILDIIMQYISKSGKKAKECLVSCGINTSFLTDWKNGKIKTPSYDKIVKLAIFLNIDLYWLFTGKEKSPSLSNDEQELLDYYKVLPERERIKLIGRAAGMADVCGERVNENKPPIIMTTMKIADVAAGAGVSTPFTLDDAFSPKEFPQDQVPPEADCGVPINGDSMEPDYPNGCIVWVKCTDSIQPGDVVIAILNGEPYCKIFQRDGLHSYNSDYDTIIINEQDNFSIFGKVIGNFDTEKV